ncbi:LuxR C-terminal-related transcriptional regulator [Streptomyces sp. NPDC060065]|uniref:LuxR C-terminal-related transcriptional regulator n=1 Tax=Streptomyces sp. NPDC060065 TaxID=3347050 RepID=UPI0036BACAF6
MPHLPAALVEPLKVGEGDLPNPECPGGDSTLSVRHVRPPYDALESGPCDVVVLHCRDPLHDLPALHRAMGEQGVPVLLVCTTGDLEQVTTALDLGATSYLVDSDLSNRALTAAILSTAKGFTCLSPTAATALLEGLPPENARPSPPDPTGDAARLRETLTPREREVMNLLASGLRTTEIGQQLSLADKTVHNYLSNIYSKLGTSGRTSAVLLWLGITAAPFRSNPPASPV